MRTHAALFGVLTLSLRGKKEKRESGTGSNTASPLPSTLSVLQKMNFFLASCKQCSAQWCGLPRKSCSIGCMLKSCSSAGLPMQLIQNDPEKTSGVFSWTGDKQVVHLRWSFNYFLMLKVSFLWLIGYFVPLLSSSKNWFPPATAGWYGENCSSLPKVVSAVGL